MKYTRILPILTGPILIPDSIVEKQHIFRIVDYIISITSNICVQGVTMNDHRDGMQAVDPCPGGYPSIGGSPRYQAWPHVLLYVLLLGFLSGCGGLSGPRSHAPPHSVENTSRKSVLYQQYQDWKGARYRHGGLSKGGVDCSGFVYLTFRSKFGVDLPRTTLYQSQSGMGVSQRELKTGDLVFFRTGSSKRHVGIYLEDRIFLHASTSKGVMLSSMDNVYWASSYWKARRVVHGGGEPLT